MARAAVVLTLALAAACAGPSRAEHEAEIAAELEQLEAATRAGDVVAARTAAARIRELGARGHEAQRAEDLVRLIDARIEARYEPSIVALRAALADGDEALARAVLARLHALRPTGAAWELAQVFERILDGREALQGLEVETHCRFLPDPSTPGAGTCIVRLAVRAKDGVARDLEPGPLTLTLSALTIDGRGNANRGQDVRSFALPARIEVPAEGWAGVDLVSFPLELPAGARALRLTARLGLRSGSVREGGRSLPARRIQAAEGEVVLLVGRLLALGPASSSEITAAASNPAVRAEDLLDGALRVRREDRAAVLDDLAEAPLDPGSVERLAPALRWLAPEARAGSDTQAWASWFETRAREKRETTRRSEPALPRSGGGNLAGP